jgi:hypothetical protein
LQFKTSFLAGRGYDPNYSYLIYTLQPGKRDLSKYSTISFDASLAIDKGISQGYIVYVELTDGSIYNVYFNTDGPKPFISSNVSSCRKTVPWNHYSILLDQSHFVPGLNNTTSSKTLKQLLKDLPKIYFVVEVWGVPGTVTFYLDNLAFSE